MIKQILRIFFNRLKKAKIVALHCVGGMCDESPCVISKDNLKHFLASHEKYMSMDDLIRLSPRKYNGAQVITVDDGLSDLYTEVYPLLTERNIPFAAFVSADLLDHEGYITTGQLKEMSQNPLVTIGSHGCTHKCLDELSVEQQKYEICDSKVKIESLIGKEVKYFAYSNGKFTKTTQRLVKKAGYIRAVGVIPRAYNFISQMSRFDLPRSNLTDETFKKRGNE